MEIAAGNGKSKYFPPNFQGTFRHLVIIINVGHAGRDNTLSASGSVGSEAAAATAAVL
jgi:hypothetical protein